MSILTYNGVRLPYASTTKFVQKAIRDESDTDWYCTEYDIEVQCVVNVAYLAQLAPDMIPALAVPGQSVNPSDIMAVIRTRLLKHRQTLSFTFNGSEQIPLAQQGNPGKVDAQNGPKPQSCTYLLLTNTTFLLSYHIIARYWEYISNPVLSANENLAGPNRPASGVLYNRWTETMDLNFAGFTTRTREGKFRIRSDNTEGKIADRFRETMATIGVPNGFIRESSHYTVSPDGLALMYKVTDKEVYKGPPQRNGLPVYKAEGTYKEIKGPAMIKRWGEVQVKLWASKTADQGQLIFLITSICINKLGAAAGQIPANANAAPGSNPIQLIENAELTVDMYTENTVTCKMRARFWPGSSGNVLIDRLAGVGNWLGPGTTGSTVTPFSGPNDNTRPPRLLRGSAERMLQAAAYFDPNIGANLNADDQLTPGAEVGTAGKTSE